MKPDQLLGYCLDAVIRNADRPRVVNGRNPWDVIGEMKPEVGAYLRGLGRKGADGWKELDTAIKRWQGQQAGHLAKARSQAADAAWERCALILRRLRTSEGRDERAWGDLQMVAPEVVRSLRETREWDKALNSDQLRRIVRSHAIDSYCDNAEAKMLLDASVSRFVALVGWLPELRRQINRGAAPGMARPKPGAPAPQDPDPEDIGDLPFDVPATTGGR